MPGEHDRESSEGEGREAARAVLPNGVALFNERKFWEAHEAWEAGWLKATGPDKLFLQGLIQLAAAYHHVQRGTFRGGARLFAASLAKLEPFPEGYLGLDRGDAIRRASGHQRRIEKSEHINPEEFPKFRYN